MYNCHVLSYVCHHTTFGHADVQRNVHTFCFVFSKYRLTYTWTYVDILWTLFVWSVDIFNMSGGHWSNVHWTDVLTIYRKIATHEWTLWLYVQTKLSTMYKHLQTYVWTLSFPVLTYVWTIAILGSVIQQLWIMQWWHCRVGVEFIRLFL